MKALSQMMLAGLTLVLIGGAALAYAPHHAVAAKAGVAVAGAVIAATGWLRRR